jgi:hypothetical protein
VAGRRGARAGPSCQRRPAPWRDRRRPPPAAGCAPAQGPLLHKPGIDGKELDGRPAPARGGLSSFASALVSPPPPHHPTLRVAPLWATSLYSLVEPGKQASKVGAWRKVRSSGCRKGGGRGTGRRPWALRPRGLPVRCGHPIRAVADTVPACMGLPRAIEDIKPCRCTVRDRLGHWWGPARASLGRGLISDPPAGAPRTCLLRPVNALLGANLLELLKGIDALQARELGRLVSGLCSLRARLLHDSQPHRARRGLGGHTGAAGAQ